MLLVKVQSSLCNVEHSKCKLKFLNYPRVAPSVSDLP